MTDIESTTTTNSDQSTANENEVKVPPVVKPKDLISGKTALGRKARDLLKAALKLPGARKIKTKGDSYRVLHKAKAIVANRRKAKEARAARKVNRK